MAEIRFKVDTKHRKEWFTGASFSHPAKMSLPLQLWIIENYTNPGEILCDPMAGSGTLMVGCSLGRNVIAVELEQKFVDMMWANWEKIKQRGSQMGYEMGTCQILQGDARNLEGLLADKIVSSPPYAWQVHSTRQTAEEIKAMGLPGSIGSQLVSDGYGKTNGQIGNLPYGDISAIVTSPPHGDAYSIREGGQVNAEYVEKRKEALRKQGKDKLADSLKVEEYASRNPDNLGNLPYGEIDKCIFSPPYEGSLIGSDSPKYETDEYIARMAKLPSGDYSTPGRLRAIKSHESGYSANDSNIGNLKSQSYLEAMLQVYRSCFAVLRNGGLMILVTKNFIRDQKEIRLDSDTISLCEQAGFQFVERHYRKLTSQSFWRVIYRQKFPDAPVLDKEDVLVFKKVLV